MAFYTKAQILLLVELINTTNPGLNYDPLAVTTTRLGVPYPYSGDRINPFWDTTIEVFPRDASKFIGRAVVHYRRIRLERLFKHQPVRLDRWCDGTLTPEVLVDLINQQFGTTLVVADIASTTWSSRPEVQYATILNTSLCYRGQLPFIWEEGKRAFDQILDEARIDADGHYNYRDKVLHWTQWPTEVFDDRPLLTHVGFNIDYSQFCDTFRIIASGTVINRNIRLGAIIKRFMDVTDIELSLERPHTELGGLSGLTYTEARLPTALITEANADDFLFAGCVTAKADSWFRGRLLFHYNRAEFHLPFDELYFNQEQTFDFVNHEPIIEDEPRLWMLEEVSFGGPYPARKRQFTTYETLTVSQRLPVQTWPIYLDFDTSVNEDLWVRLLAKTGSANSASIAQSKVFKLKQWDGATLTSHVSEIDYDASATVVVENVPYRSGTTLNYDVKATGGSFHLTYTGSVRVDNGRVEISTTIGLAEITRGVRGYVVTLYHADGSKLLSTPETTLINVNVEITKERQSFFFGVMTRNVEANTGLLVTLAGGGGGGTGQGTSGSGSGWVQGRRGGDGQLVEFVTTFSEATQISFAVPQGGNGGGTGEPGQPAAHTTLRAGGVLLARALGGLGGRMSTGRGSNGNFAVPSTPADRSPRHVGSAGAGSSRSGYGGSGSRGKSGWIELTYVRRV